MQHFEAPMVSVIVPVYNVEKYLSRCLDSILAQSLQSIEVICIDDGSIDRSPEILNEYAGKDARIKVITQENKGLCEVRKKGISISSGRYLGFVDSDDWVAPEMYERLVDRAEHENCDMVLCDYYLSRLGELTYTKGYAGKKLTVKEFMQIDAPPYLCMKLFRADLKEYMMEAKGTNQAEDVGMLYPLLPHVKKMGYVPEALYYYFQRADSSSNADSFVVNYGIEEYLSQLRNLFQYDYGRYTPFAKKHFVQMVYWGLKTPSRRPFLADYIEFLQEVSPQLIGCPQLKQFKDLTQYLCSETIPKTIIFSKQDVSGHCADVCMESWKYYARNCTLKELESNMPSDVPEIVLRARDAGAKGFVDDYLKLRYVYENGGIVIDNSVKLNKPIGELRTCSAFVGYQEENHINTRFWGAVKEHPLLQSILMSYEEDSLVNQIDVNLGMRFYFALCTQYKLPQGDTKEHLLGDGVKIFRCDKLSYRINANNVAQLYDDAIASIEANGMLAAPQSILGTLMAEAQKGAADKNKRQLAECERELSRVKNSRSWRITRPLRKLFNFFRKVKYPACEVE